MKRFFAVFIARNLEFFRDTSTLIWIFVLPVLLIFGFAFAFPAGGGTTFTVGTVGGGAIPSWLEFKAFKLVPYASTDEALAKLSHHQLDLVVDPGAGEYYVNEGSLNGSIVEKMIGADAGGELARRTVTGEPIRYIDWFVPGVIGMNILFGSISGVGFVIVRYRRNGVLKRFKATPLRAIEFVGAQMLSRFFIVAFISAVIYAGTNFFLHFRMEGSWFLLVLTATLAVLCMISLGLLFSSRMKSEEVAGGIMNLITWPMMILSGVFFSLEGTPAGMRIASKIFPLTHFVEASRAIMLDGAGLQAIALNLAVLAGMTVLFLAAAAATFKWE